MCSSWARAAFLALVWCSSVSELATRGHSARVWVQSFLPSKVCSRPHGNRATGKCRRWSHSSDHRCNLTVISTFAWVRVSRRRGGKWQRGGTRGTAGSVRASRGAAPHSVFGIPFRLVGSLLRLSEESCRGVGNKMSRLLLPETHVQRGGRACGVAARSQAALGPADQLDERKW